MFFDAGNTLLWMNYPVIAAQLATLGIRVAPADVQRAEWRARVLLDEAILTRSQAGTSTESRSTSGRYLRYLLAGLGIADEPTIRAVDEWRRAYNLPVGLWNTADPGAERALRLVRAAGLRAAVISNSNGSVRSILELLGLAPHLEFVLDSSEVGVEKPDPRIFQLALERSGLEPGEAVYVGDLYSVDVLGARAVGMGAVLLDPGGCWGERDCHAAPDLFAAVRLVITGPPGSASSVDGAGARRRGAGQSGRVTKG